MRHVGSTILREDVMKISIYLLITLVLYGIVMLFVLRGIMGSWRRVWCRFVKGGCDWRWQYNVPRYINRSSRPMWVGIYECPHCVERSDGCAQWRQRSLEVGTPGDEHQRFSVG
jgi:hypothetical protein